MTKEIFFREIRRHLGEQMARCPAMEQQDVVKFVFQALLGVGHLLSSREEAEEFVIRETDRQPAVSGEPLYEELSPSWCRISLRGARERGIPPSVVSGLMFTQDGGLPFTRQDVLGFCRELAASGNYRITDPDALNRILDEGWLPSHSPAYRQQYLPAYRVIPAEWIPRTELIRRIAERKAERTLVTVDGPCASGKTTLAEKLSSVYHAAVVHTDEYVIPHAQKTAERLAVPGGNCDADRLAREVAAPWNRGEPVLYRRYDCRKDLLLPAEKLPDCRLLILEGSYCNLPVIRQYADIRVFVKASWETRAERLRKRESPQSLQMFRDRWIPLEDRYFSAFGLPDPDCVLLPGDC